VEISEQRQSVLIFLLFIHHHSHSVSATFIQSPTVSQVKLSVYKIGRRILDKHHAMREVWIAVCRLDVESLYSALEMGCNVDEPGFTCNHSQTEFLDPDTSILKRTRRESILVAPNKMTATPLQLLVNMALGDSMCNGKYESYLTLIRVLLKHGADREVLSSCSGKTPLMQIVSMTLIESGDHLVLRAMMMSTLIFFGANINVVGPCGRTPLCIAIYGKWMMMIELLIYYGADLSTVCDVRCCRTPSRCAQYLLYMDMVCREAGMVEHVIRPKLTRQIQLYVEHHANLQQEQTVRTNSDNLRFSLAPGYLPRKSLWTKLRRVIKTKRRLLHKTPSYRSLMFAPPGTGSFF
jgi:hypothetical protein